MLSLSATTTQYEYYKGNISIATGTMSCAETTLSEDV
jgi:hypothetical protein